MFIPGYAGHGYPGKLKYIKYVAGGGRRAQTL